MRTRSIHLHKASLGFMVESKSRIKCLAFPFHFSAHPLAAFAHWVELSTALTWSGSWYRHNNFFPNSTTIMWFQSRLIPIRLPITWFPPSQPTWSNSQSLFGNRAPYIHMTNFPGAFFFFITGPLVWFTPLSPFLSDLAGIIWRFKRGCQCIHSMLE